MKLMAGSDSPNFDWLKRELESELPASGQDSSTSLVDPPAELPESAPSSEADSAVPDEPESSMEPDSVEPPESESLPEAGSAVPSEDVPLNEQVLEDIAGAEGTRFPAPQLNVSEGATLVIRNRELDPLEDQTLPLAAEAALSYSPPETLPEDPPQADSTGVLPSLPETMPSSDSVPIAAEAATDSGIFSDSTVGSILSPPPVEIGDTVLEGTPSSNQTADDGHTEVLAAADVGALQKPWPQFEAFTAAPFIPGDEITGSAPPAASKIPAKESGPQGPSRFFILLASYASALTLAFIMLLLQNMARSARPHQLESLPDIPHEKVDKLSYVPPHSGLAPGHTLALGESQRFGNILVEPLKITDEPAEFVHYSGNPNEKLPPTKPVWKLWLKLTNVSSQQIIAPLDRNLVLRWVIKADSQQEFSNQYITQQNAPEKSPPVVQLYHLPASSSWDMKDQDLGKALGPGESYVTYLVSDEEGLDQLPDDLVWRVQMRKGYSAKGHGVTTIFEVAFHKKDIVTPKTALLEAGARFVNEWVFQWKCEPNVPAVFRAPGPACS
jgi:hypothetical protein